MKTRYAAVIVFFFLSAMLIAIAQTPRRQSAPHPSGTNNIAEAQEKVRAEFESKVAKCGESYFAGNGAIGGARMEEWRDCAPVLNRVNPVSEADRLNGVLWSGQIEMRCTVFREFANGGWQAWQDYTHENGFTFNVIKFSSGWRLDSTSYAWNFFHKSECPNAPKSKVSFVNTASASAWDVELRKSDGWFDTGVRIGSGQMLNIVADDFDAPSVNQKVDLRLSKSDASLVPQRNPNSPYKSGIHIYYMNVSDVGKYKTCLQNQTWVAAKPGWSDTVKLKVGDSNPVDSIKLHIILFPASFHKEMDCMAGK